MGNWFYADGKSDGGWIVILTETCLNVYKTGSHYSQRSDMRNMLRKVFNEAAATFFISCQIKSNDCPEPPILNFPRQYVTGVGRKAREPYFANSWMIFEIFCNFYGCFILPIKANRKGH